MPVADGDLAVRAQVDKRSEFVAAPNSGGDDSGQNVGADEAADTAGKTNNAIGGQIPTEFTRCDTPLAEMRRLKGHVSKRLDIDSGKQVMHNGVADQDDFVNLTLASLRKARDELAERNAQGRRQVVAIECSANAAHHIGTKSGLRIERGLDAEHSARRNIDDLRGNGGRANVNGDLLAGFGMRFR